MQTDHDRRSYPCSESADPASHYNLYGRNVTIFPPQVLDAGQTFFGQEQSAGEGTPGRRYLGISTTGCG